MTRHERATADVLLRAKPTSEPPPLPVVATYPTQPKKLPSMPIMRVQTEKPTSVSRSKSTGVSHVEVEHHYEMRLMPGETHPGRVDTSRLVIDF